MRMPSFSIIIPTYNRARFLGRAIRSVLPQMQPGDELVVVDDGSTDDTAAVLAAFGNRITVVHGRHGGAGKARNLGLARAQGDLVAFLDSDDEYLPGKLAIQRRFLAARPDVLFCFTNFRVERLHGRLEHRYLERWHPAIASWEEVFGPGVRFSSLASLPENVPDFLVYDAELYLPHLTKFYVLTDTLAARRREAGDALRFAEDLPIYEEQECMIRLSRQGKAAFLDVETALQRSYAHDRLSDGGVLRQLEARIVLLERIWGRDQDFLREHGDKYRATLDELRERRIRALLLHGKHREARDALGHGARVSWPTRVLSRAPAPVSRLVLDLRRAAMQIWQQASP